MSLQFKARYFEMNQTTSSSSQPASKRSKAGGLKKLIREVLSDSEYDLSTNPATSMAIGDPLRPWRAEFLSYLETIEAALPPGMSTIQWWGVSIAYAALNPKFRTNNVT
jgi:hypothetical protein